MTGIFPLPQKMSLFICFCVHREVCLCDFPTNQHNSTKFRLSNSSEPLCLFTCVLGYQMPGCTLTAMAGMMIHETVNFPIQSTSLDLIQNMQTNHPKFYAGLHHTQHRKQQQIFEPSCVTVTAIIQCVSHSSAKQPCQRG